MWYACDVSVCSVVCRCQLFGCNCDVFSFINVYHDPLKFCVVCINGRSYACL